MCAYTARRLAVKFGETPTLFLEYTDSKQNVHVRAVKLTKLPQKVNLERLTNKVIRAFPRGLDPSTVNTDQIHSLLQEVVNRCISHQPAAAPANDNSSCYSAIRRSSNNGGGNRGGSHSNEHRAVAVTSTTGTGQAAINATQATCYTPTDTYAASHNPHDYQQYQHCQQQQQQQHASILQPASRRPSYNCGGQSSSTTSQQEQQQQPDAGGALADFTPGLDQWLDGGASGSVMQTSVQQQQDRKLSCGTSSSNSCSDNCAKHQTVHCSHRSHADAIGAAAAAGQPHALPAAAAAATAGTDGNASDDSDCLTLEPDCLTHGEMDLNKVSDYELRLAKSHMQTQFVQHQVLPDDPSYVYDKQVDFVPQCEANEWDEDD